MEELTDPLPECTVTDDPSGNALDPESRPGSDATLLDEVQFVPLQLLVAVRLFLPEPDSAEACALELMDAAADECELLLAAVAHGSFT